jgi:hypothetical protein
MADELPQMSAPHRTYRLTGPHMCANCAYFSPDWRCALEDTTHRFRPVPGGTCAWWLAVHMAGLGGCDEQ